MNLTHCRCYHVQQALSATEYAPKTSVDTNNLDGLTELQADTLKRTSKGGKLELFTLPGGNFCVPLLADESVSLNSQFTHVMNGKVRSDYLVKT